MAALKSPHWEATPPEIRPLLETIAPFPFSRRFYLGGGTALALRLGHRMSHDLDFFSETDRVGDATRAEILSHLRRAFADVLLMTDAPGDLAVSVSDRRVGFYSYGYRMLERGDDLLNIQVAGLLDIAAMKLDAIAGRGARRDFYDLDFLAKRIPREELFARAQVKYPHMRDFAMTVMPYLNDFRNAERDRPVETLRTVTWEEVKAFFLSEARRLANVWYLPSDKTE